MDNACFAWSIVAALYPAEKNMERKSSYPYYTTVLHFKDIEFPMALNQIKKFENQNNISINIYCIEKKKEFSILPIRFTAKKLNKHVDFLYVQDDNTGHFVWIKNLSRLVSSNAAEENSRNYFATGM